MLSCNRHCATPATITSTQLSSHIVAFTSLPLHDPLLSALVALGSSSLTHSLTHSLTVLDRPLCTISWCASRSLIRLTHLDPEQTCVWTRGQCLALELQFSVAVLNLPSSFPARSPSAFLHHRTRVNCVNLAVSSSSAHRLFLWSVELSSGRGLVNLSCLLSGFILATTRPSQSMCCVLCKHRTAVSVHRISTVSCSSSR